MNKTMLSASEVNRFCYCRQQWYYTRVYGAARLNELRRERNRKLGLPEKTNPGAGAFERGRVFHRYFKRNYIIKRTLKWLAVIGLAVFLCWLAWAGYIPMG